MQLLLLMDMCMSIHWYLAFLVRSSDKLQLLLGLLRQHTIRNSMLNYWHLLISRKHLDQRRLRKYHIEKLKVNILKLEVHSILNFRQRREKNQLQRKLVVELCSMIVVLHRRYIKSSDHKLDPKFSSYGHRQLMQVKLLLQTSFFYFKINQII